MMAEKVYYESQQEPLLPRYTLESFYGIQHRDEIESTSLQLNSVRSSNGHSFASTSHVPIQLDQLSTQASSRTTGRFPSRASGSLVLPSIPISTSTKRQLHLVSGQNVAEEYPFKMVSVPWSNKGSPACLKAFSLDTVHTTKPHTFQSVIANRHLPHGLGVFYMEVEVDTQGSLIVGLTQFKTKFGVEGESDTDAEILTNTDQIVNSTVSDLRGQMIESNSAEHDAGHGQEGISHLDDNDEDERERYGNNGNESNDEHMGRLPITNFGSMSDDEDIDEMEYESSSSQETDEGSETGTLSGDEQILNPHTSQYLGHFSIRPNGKKPRIFKTGTIRYDRRPHEGVDSLCLEAGSQKSSAPMWHWDVKDGFFVDGKSNIIIKGDEPIKRAGLIVDRVQKKLVCIADGRSLSPPIDFDVDDSEGELFPFVLLCDAKCKVNFGDGRLPNDGFKFAIRDYTSKIWDSTLMPANKIPTNPSDYMSLVHTSQSKTQINIKCNQLISEYVQFYGYGSESSTNGDLRTAVFSWDFPQIRNLLADYDLSTVEFDLQFSEFVIMCLDPARSADALQSGRRLLQLATPEQANEIKLASTIIVTQEPREEKLARFYGNVAKTTLLRKLLLLINPPTKLQQLAHSQSDKTNICEDNERKASAVAKIHQICGAFWEW